MIFAPPEFFLLWVKFWVKVVNLPQKLRRYNQYSGLDPMGKFKGEQETGPIPIQNFPLGAGPDGTELPTF